MIRKWISAMGLLCFGALPIVGCIGASDSDSSEGGDDSQASEDSSTKEEGLSWYAGWHYVTWGSAGLRPWNPSSCNGTVTCVLHAGDWVYWPGQYISGCGGYGNDNSGDAYIHYSACGNGWVRIDALN